jgi:aldehyde:ferredoxin oxidoreductase
MWKGCCRPATSSGAASPAPLPDGLAAGHRYTDEDIAWLRADYYRVRGWDGHGVPKPETLAALGVEYPNT